MTWETARAGACSSALLGAVAASAGGRAADGDPAAGHELASKFCTACHIVGSERVGSDAAPPFQAIAQDPARNLTELHGWHGPMHPVLPNLALSTRQIADINAYLDSLRAPSEDRAPAAPEGTAPPAATQQPPPSLQNAPPAKIGPPIEPSPVTAPHAGRPVSGGFAARCRGDQRSADFAPGGAYGATPQADPAPASRLPKALLLTSNLA